MKTMDSEILGDEVYVFSIQNLKTGLDNEKGVSKFISIL
jgi:hypothetical protein